MILCSCDPDCNTPAFAVFHDTKLVKWELLKTGKGRQVDGILPEIKDIIDTWRPGLLVIENQYLPLGQEGARRFRSISRLVAARAMITTVFVLSGVHYRIVDPFTWQRTLGGSVRGREQLKMLSIIKASEIAGEMIEDHNIADAINIGYWFATKNRLATKPISCVG